MSPLTLSSMPLECEAVAAVLPVELGGGAITCRTDSRTSLRNPHMARPGCAKKKKKKKKKGSLQRPQQYGECVFHDEEGQSKKKKTK